MPTLLTMLLILSNLESPVISGNPMNSVDSNSLGSGIDLFSTQNLIYYSLGLIIILLVIVILIFLRIIKSLSKILLTKYGVETPSPLTIVEPIPQEKKINFWTRALSLRPLSEEKSLLMDHEFDGIQELDNPIPSWFNFLFYGTISFGVVYLLIYHVFSWAPLQDEEYRLEMNKAALAKKEFLSKQANKVDENSIKLDLSAEVLASGKSIFLENCSSCHGNNGQGLVGPNLTDDYWLHGSKINDLFKTIEYGVAAKGMPTWENRLSPKQIGDVANYIKSLRGTHPLNPKEPQGQLETTVNSSKPNKKA